MESNLNFNLKYEWNIKLALNQYSRYKSSIIYYCKSNGMEHISLLNTYAVCVQPICQLKTSLFSELRFTPNVYVMRSNHPLTYNHT